MPDRINKVVTKSGDEGTTSLADGRRWPKAHPRIDLVGTLDEANSFIGMLHTLVGDTHQHTLLEIQSRLFDAGGAVAMGEPAAPGTRGIERAGFDWTRLSDALEIEIERLNSQLPVLKEFVLPGGNRAAAAAHVVRAVTRRAERLFWAADITHLEQAGLGIYLNRLSDFFFVLARTLIREAGDAERFWEPYR